MGNMFNKSMFGRDISVYQDKDGVSNFVKWCLEAIEENDEGVKTDALYRANGGHLEVQSIRTQSEKKMKEALSKEKNIHVLTGALKLFFRTLNTPILDINDFSEVLNNRKEGNQIYHAQLVEVMLKYRTSKGWATLKVLFEHLNMVMHVEENKMSLAGLGVVFGPALMHEKITITYGVDVLQSRMEDMNLVVELLLQNYSEIFEEKEEDKAQKQELQNSDQRRNNGLLKEDDNTVKENTEDTHENINQVNKDATLDRDREKSVGNISIHSSNVQPEIEDDSYEKISVGRTDVIVSNPDNIDDKTGVTNEEMDSNSVTGSLATLAERLEKSSDIVESSAGSGRSDDKDGSQAEKSSCEEITSHEFTAADKKSVGTDRIQEGLDEATNHKSHQEDTAATGSESNDGEQKSEQNSVYSDGTESVRHLEEIYRNTHLDEFHSLSETTLKHDSSDIMSTEIVPAQVLQSDDSVEEIALKIQEYDKEYRHLEAVEKQFNNDCLQEDATESPELEPNIGANYAMIVSDPLSVEDAKERSLPYEHEDSQGSLERHVRENENQQSDLNSQCVTASSELVVAQNNINQDDINLTGDQIVRKYSREDPTSTLAASITDPEPSELGDRAFQKFHSSDENAVGFDPNPSSEDTYSQQSISKIVERLNSTTDSFKQVAKNVTHFKNSTGYWTSPNTNMKVVENQTVTPKVTTPEKRVSESKKIDVTERKTSEDRSLSGIDLLKIKLGVSNNVRKGTDLK